MQRDAAINELLNEVLTAELTSVNQYFVDYKMLENWGYEPLARALPRRVDRRDEGRRRAHRSDPLPRGRARTCSASARVRVGETVPEKLQLALDLEYESIERLNLGIAKLPRARRQRHARAARAHPRRRGRPRRLARDAARASCELGETNYLAQQIRN